MITVCAWCPKNGRPPAVLSDDGRKDMKISHGICEPCAEKLNAEEDGDATGVPT